MDILQDIKAMQPKKITYMETELYDIHGTLSRVEHDIKSINKNNKKQSVSEQLFKEELEDKNKEIFKLKSEIDEKQHNEVKIYKKIMLVLDQINNIYKYAKHVEDNDLIDSLEAVKKIIRKEMSEIHLEEIQSLGEIFNPEVHKCIGTSKDDSKQSYEIVSVIEEGYKLNGKVLRAASVIIAE